MAALDGSQPCPYASLPDSVSPHLQVVVHFTLVFRDAVQLQPPALVYPHLEFSLLRARGIPYRSLTHYLASTAHRSPHRIRARLEPLSSVHRIQAIRELVENVVASGCVRAQCSAQNLVAPFVRARVSHRDSQRRSYMWLRGPDELSTRFLIGTRRLHVIASENGIKQHVHDLSASMQRSDVVAASWLSSRFERAQQSSIDALTTSKVTRAYTTDTATEATTENASTDLHSCSSDQAPTGNVSEASASTASEQADRSFNLDSEWEQTDETQSEEEHDEAQETSDGEWVQIEVFRRQKPSAPTVRGRHHINANSISARSLRAERRVRARSIGDERSSAINKPSKSDRQRRVEQRARRALCWK
ncbi:unnamed protein product [Agarophyton chilense]